MSDASLILLMLGLLMLAAWHDIATRLIPDGLCLAVLLVSLALRVPVGWPALLASLGVGCMLFCALLALAMRGFLGGGDVKLAGALVVAMPPAAAWDFLVATVLAGGVLAAGYLAAARFAPRSPGGHGLLGRVLAVEAWRIRRRGPLPYAVAIAAGGAVALLGSPGP
ncbi:prepilin peptidase [Roseomonas sp. BN140053]|uniref:prepilin peptidase n=1 Tax=Roseomonas sp. BN140053 TaxID=3391898 RepID=UPI0039E87DE9